MHPLLLATTEYLCTKPLVWLQRQFDDPLLHEPVGSLLDQPMNRKLLVKLAMINATSTAK